MVGRHCRVKAEQPRRQRFYVGRVGRGEAGDDRRAVPLVAVRSVQQAGELAPQHGCAPGVAEHCELDVFVDAGEAWRTAVPHCVVRQEVGHRPAVCVLRDRPLGLGEAVAGVDELPCRQPAAAVHDSRPAPEARPHERGLLEPRCLDADRLRAAGQRLVVDPVLVDGQQRALRRERDRAVRGRGQARPVPH